jgi:hypothetical protein
MSSDPRLYLLAKMNDMNYMVEPARRANQIGAILLHLESKIKSILSKTPIKEGVSLKQIAIAKCDEFVDNAEFPVLAKISRNVRATLRALPPRNWDTLPDALPVSFSVPEGTLRIESHNLTLYPKTRQVLWTRPRFKKKDLYEPRCLGCKKCTDDRPSRGTTTALYSLSHFYNHYLKYYVPWYSRRLYNSHSLEDMSCHFCIEDGTALSSVLDDGSLLTRH